MKEKQINTRIMFVGNYKGGVGKTTSVLNFAEHFAQAGKNVLVLDLDPQSSLSEVLVSNNGGDLSGLDEKKTLNYIFDLHILKIKKYNNISLGFGMDIVQTYKKGKFDFVASSLFYRKGMGLDDLAVRMEDQIEYLSILKVFLDDVLEMENYDYVLIDCPPSNNLITRSAFLLSDYYIIPTILDRVSVNGVAHYINTVNKTYDKYCEDPEDGIVAKHYFGENPKLVGIFCTFIRGQVSYEEALTNLKDTICYKCGYKTEDVYFFEEKINNYIDIARSTEIGQSSKARRDYKELSQKVLKRIQEMECK